MRGLRFGADDERNGIGGGVWRGAAGSREGTVKVRTVLGEGGEVGGVAASIVV